MQPPQDDRLADPVKTYEGLLEHPDIDNQEIAVGIDKAVKTVGHIVMWANVLLITAIVAQVALRYALNLNFPKLDE
ncbi:MAG: C4-dicarboxylate ABC transporter, partial [Pseudomonadota bacterium]